MPTILIVDDDDEIRTQMKWGLADRYKIVQAEDRASAVAAFKSSSPAVTLLDLGLPPHPGSTKEGMAAVADLLALDDQAKIIIISGQADKKNALEAVAAGAYDFLTKPVAMEELILVLKRCIYLAEIEDELREIQAQHRPEDFEGILAGCGKMHAVFKMIRKVGASTAPVFILGESGTGKEMVASAIHKQSKRKGKFVAINCGAIPADLIESELFGHEKGAFTGAHAQRKGLVETAEGGTIFLDEVGELPPPVQVKLLRFLQEKRIQRVGGREEMTVDARIVAATNADLTMGIKEGTFREDLYFRLAVVVVQLPPLRERGDDAILLARRFLATFATENGKKDKHFATETLAAIQQHPWPGNVRELQNRVQRAVIMADGKRITLEDMEMESSEDCNRPAHSLREAREAVERKLVVSALARHDGNVSASAKDLEISRPTLYELMEKLGIERATKESS